MKKNFAFGNTLKELASKPPESDLDIIGREASRVGKASNENLLERITQRFNQNLLNGLKEYLLDGTITKKTTVKELMEILKERS
jgi:hypothetical protein